ncbi:disintegrin and metalloproteinase domain-containing protein 15-like isoform X3 [Carassius carassius]|uniref:disintegrin and metalloproteinase domain-containing protein 15-like isoform X3 n=1 Tax=Carassius carassius TaxID=217509 RepID=UPI0028690A96|nr:disintegrin and metalloproteinase domain-containing protein 15-like isoform X3 [Carassius carassius]
MARCAFTCDSSSDRWPLTGLFLRSALIRYSISIQRLDQSVRCWTMKHHHQLFRCFWRTLVTVLLFEGTPLLMFRGSLTLTLNRDDSSFTRITNSSHSVTSHRRELKPLAKTRPFAVINGVRRSLSDVLQNGHPDRLQCGLQLGSSTYILDLEKNKALLPKPPNVFYYLPNGTGVSMKENPVMHCYYHGSVQGFPQSRVALSSCSGLRGVIVINATLSFELHPEEEKHDREEEGRGEMEEGWMHGIYPTDSQTSKSKDCGVSHTSIPPIQIIPHTHRSKRDILSETKYIELVLVVDHKEYLNYQKNNKTIIYRMLDVANQVDWFYRPLNVRVALVGLEIWSDQDKIKVDKNPTETLNRFLDWRTGDLLPRLRHDNAQLIMGESFDGTTVGMASQSSMCSKDRSGGVNVDHLVSVLGVASTVAHELGHNLGMSHDTADRRCQCQNEPRLGGCIMEPSTGFMPGQLFSSCSERDLSLSLLHGGGMCLFNVPQPESLQGGPRCGNLYVERGEECDCGLLDECNDPCCNASTCKLVPGAQCSSDGICCENCKLRVAGSVCREPLGECDLPEYCTGTSPYCPPNVFLQNGESCKDGSSYCYSGACASLDEQCQMLWGQNSTHAPPICFSSVNKQGNKYGNCGQMSNGSYIPCLKGDVHCGRIQCQGGNERPLLGSNAEILTTTVKLNQSDFTCRGAYFNLGDDVSDPAMVSQGTACGPSKACVDQQCRDVAMFGVEECRRKCNGHGVCNSNKNCHCDDGWAPPDCRYSGTGGSVDSGPARKPKDSDPAQVALLVIFLFVLPVSLLFVALRFPRCRRGLVYLGNTPFNKSRQSRGVSVAYIEYCVKEENQRTPAVELANARNGDQVQPLRYQWPHQSDIPLTQAISKLAGHWPAPPTKPLPPDPIPSESKMQCKPTGARPAAPSKPLPSDPVLSTQQNPVPPKPPVPKKPLPVNLPSSHAPPPPLLGHPGPAASSSSYSCNPASAAAPARPAPHPPLRRQQYPRIPHTLHQI